MVNYPLSVSFNLTSNLHDRPSEPSSNPEYLSGNQPHATFLKLHDVHSILLEEIYQLMETTATSLPKTTFFIRFLRLLFSHQLIRIDNLNRMSNSVMQIWHKISEIRFFESGRISFRSQLNFLINCNGSFTSRSNVESNAENQKPWTGTCLYANKTQGIASPKLPGNSSPTPITMPFNVRWIRSRQTVGLRLVRNCLQLQDLTLVQTNWTSSYINSNLQSETIFSGNFNRVKTEISALAT